MRLTTLTILGQPRNSRELIIRLLADTPFMSFGQLYRAVRKSGFPMSKQALHRGLQALIKDGQVIRKEWGVYTISPNWIKIMRGFCDIVERHCLAAKNDKELIL